VTLLFLLCLIIPVCKLPDLAMPLLFDNKQFISQLCLFFQCCIETLKSNFTISILYLLFISYMSNSACHIVQFIKHVQKLHAQVLTNSIIIVYMGY